ncbi:MAG: methyltransferase domain-containing protein [Candidatus Paceibacterota bacterium]
MSFTNPQDTLRELGLHPGMEVADLGAGGGHYTLAAARIVGESGHVCAVEIQKDLVTKLKNEAEQAGFSCVDVVWSDLGKAEGSTLKGESIDIVILSNVLFQAQDKAALLAEGYRILRPSGKLLLIDWSDSHGGLGPRPDHVVKRDVALKLAESTGFSVSGDASTGTHHWGVILVK